MTNKDYREWLVQIKNKVKLAQLKAASNFNIALIELYWDLEKRLFPNKQNTNGERISWNNFQLISKKVSHKSMVSLAGTCTLSDNGILSFLSNLNLCHSLWHNYPGLIKGC